MLSHIHCVLMLPYGTMVSLGKNQTSHITARDCYCQCRHKHTGNLMPAVSHTNDVRTFSGGKVRLHRPSFADLISKPRALHQKLAFESTAGRSPLKDWKVVEKDHSSPLKYGVSEYSNHIRLYLFCRQHKTLKELHQAN